MEQDPTIKASIIIRAYNAEATVGRAIESALKQEFPRTNYEIIIVNDGSTDNTRGVIDTYASEPGVRIIHQANIGVIPAANRGLKESRGVYVTLLDSDDEFMPQLLSEMVGVLDAHPAVAFAYCNYHEEIDGVVQDIQIEDVFQFIAVGTTFRRPLFEQEGWFSTMSMFSEHELVLRTWGRWKFIHVPKSLVTYHRQRESLTGDHERVAHELEVLKARHPEHLAEINRIRSFMLP
ncbi:MAG: glycosyltransferase family 2 protein [bacterium]|nr:glycosyltransferase family 2 protein [bacterium]